MSFKSYIKCKFFNCRVTAEKNTALLRNAEISQQMELVKQDMRRQERDMNDLLNKLTQLEEENDKLKESTLIQQKLTKNIVELEDQISEKNKVMIYIFIDIFFF